MSLAGSRASCRGAGRWTRDGWVTEHRSHKDTIAHTPDWGLSARSCASAAEIWGNRPARPRVWTVHRELEAALPPPLLRSSTRHGNNVTNRTCCTARGTEMMSPTGLAAQSGLRAAVLGRPVLPTGRPRGFPAGPGSPAQFRTSPDPSSRPRSLHLTSDGGLASARGQARRHRSLAWDHTEHSDKGLAAALTSGDRKRNERRRPKSSFCRRQRESLLKQRKELEAGPCPETTGRARVPEGGSLLCRTPSRRTRDKRGAQRRGSKTNQRGPRRGRPSRARTRCLPRRAARGSVCPSSTLGGTSVPNSGTPAVTACFTARVTECDLLAPVPLAALAVHLVLHPSEGVSSEGERDRGSGWVTTAFL